MTLHNNSLVAYAAINDLEDRQERVLEAIRNHPDSSRNDISRMTNMMPKNVSSRICELEDLGLIVRTGRKHDTTTGRPVNTFSVREGT